MKRANSSSRTPVLSLLLLVLTALVLAACASHKSRASSTTRITTHKPDGTVIVEEIEQVVDSRTRTVFEGKSALANQRLENGGGQLLSIGALGHEVTASNVAPIIKSAAEAYGTIQTGGAAEILKSRNAETLKEQALREALRQRLATPEAAR